MIGRVAAVDHALNPVSNYVFAHTTAHPDTHEIHTAHRAQITRERERAHSAPRARRHRTSLECEMTRCAAPAALKKCLYYP